MNTSHQHTLHDGRRVWIQHTVISYQPWAVVISQNGEPPEILRRNTREECLDILAEILKQDVLSD